MIIDKRSEFCDATPLNTGGAGSYLIGSQIDLGATPELHDPGEGTDLFLVGIVRTAATSGGSATAAFQLRSDDTAAIHTSTSTLHLTTPAIPVANMTAGAEICRIGLPRGRNYERFLGIVQVTGTAAFTAGAVDFFITMSPGKYTAYPEAA